LNSLWQYRLRNLFSITIICLSFLTVGIFLSLANNLDYTADQISQNLSVILFLENDLPEEDIAALERAINESELFVFAQYVGAEEAMAKFKEKFPNLQDIVANLDINPFPPSFEATLRESVPEDIDARLAQMRSLRGVEDIQYNREWVERMESLSRLAKAVGFFLGGILILASFFIISNVIKLNVMARKDEIAILRLVGGSNMFIRIPFLLEGLVLGFFGGLLSLLMLFILIKIFPFYLGASLGVLGDLINFRFLSLSQALTLVLSGCIIGVLGSSSSLSKFMKV
jgi:cell division transport system permease protein